MMSPRKRPVRTVVFDLKRYKENLNQGYTLSLESVKRKMHLFYRGN